MSAKAHLRFDDGLTKNKGFSKSQNIFHLPTPSSTASPSSINGTSETNHKPHTRHDPPILAIQTRPPSSDTPPLSNREAKKLKKKEVWMKKMAEKDEAKATVEREGKKLPSEEKVVTGGEDEIKFLQAKKKRQRERVEEQSNHHQKPREYEANSKKKRKRSNPEPLPLLNNKPMFSKSEINQQPHTAQVKAQALKLRAQREQLPIWGHQTQLRKLLRERDVLVMLGQTGSGKSTQIGQFLVDEAWMKRRSVKIEGQKDEHKVGGCIAITQPRRVAATNLARRVAQEMGVRLGEEVGYAVRFDNKTGKETKVKFLTDGMLLQEMLLDPLLKQYSAVVVDEAHERTVGTDLVMGFLRGLIYGPRRGSLKVIIMSATLEVERMARFFDESRGRDVAGLERIDDVEEKKEINNTPKTNGDTNGTHRDSSEEVKDPPRINGIFGESRKEKRRREKRERKRREKLLEQKTGETVQNEVPKDVTPVQEQPKNQINGYFGTVATFHVPGRQYPVEIYHSPDPVADYVDAALRTVFQVHYGEPMPGDILVFLTGQEEIEMLQKLIVDYSETMASGVPRIHVLPLYAALPSHVQQKVFTPAPGPNMRKVILATNIAETSVTVSGVRYVIDCGNAKTKQYRPKIGMESLLVTPISKSSAMQRTGRAGREAPGKCYRLYTESSFHGLAEVTAPEILRANIANAILTLKARGQDDVMGFDYLDQPSRDSMFNALEQLLALGALGIDGKITDLGRKMARLPLSPSLARVLLAAIDPEMNCLSEVIDIIAGLSVENLFPQPLTDEKREEMEEARQEFRRGEGDHLTLLTAIRAYDSQRIDRKKWTEQHFMNHRAMQSLLDIRKQLRENCRSLAPTTTFSDDETDTSISPDLAERILKCFLRGFYNHTAKIVPDGGYRTLVGANQDVGIHPSSVLFGAKREGILYHEYVFTSRPYARWCSAIQLDWVQEAAPQYLAFGRGE